jgi:Fe-S-cluster containining protein
VDPGRVFSLSFHADYRCEHSGVCCSSDWDVPVELPIYRSLKEALSTGRIVPVEPAYGGEPPLITDDLPDDAAAMLARTATGDCVFYHRHTGLCVVHRDGGETDLPSTCRNFPRVAVRDRRGTFVSLTHFCPTAARSLFREDVPIAIVEAPPAFPPRDYDGLTVDDDAWPPLLHPRMLMDLEGYSAWEHHMVARCADATATAEDVLATLRRDVELLRRFVPGPATLTEAVQRLPADVVRASPHARLEESLAMRDQVITAVPDDLKPPVDHPSLAGAFTKYVVPEWSAWQSPLRRYLAAKAFANWTAHQGRGIRAIIRGLEAALSLVRVEAARQCETAERPLDAELLREAFRAADFLLNHLAVGDELASAWSHAEEG